MICDIVSTQYPEMMEAIRELKKLKDAAKLDLGDTLKDINHLDQAVNQVAQVSNSAPCCDEDR